MRTAAKRIVPFHKLESGTHIPEIRRSQDYRQTQPLGRPDRGSGKVHGVHNMDHIRQNAGEIAGEMIFNFPIEVFSKIKELIAFAK